MSKVNQNVASLNDAIKTTKHIAVMQLAFLLLKKDNYITVSNVTDEFLLTYPDYHISESEIAAHLTMLVTEKVLKIDTDGSFFDPKAGSKNKNHGNVQVTVEAVNSDAKKAIPSNSVNLAAKAAIKKAITPAEIPGKRISRTQALELMQNNKGHFFTATFTTKKNKLRTINCQYLKDSTSELGYVKVRETSKLRKGEESIRNVNLQTLEELVIGGKMFQVG